VEGRLGLRGRAGLARDRPGAPTYLLRLDRTKERARHASSTVRVGRAPGTAVGTPASAFSARRRKGSRSAGLSDLAKRAIRSSVSALGTASTARPSFQHVAALKGRLKNLLKPAPRNQRLSRMAVGSCHEPRRPPQPSAIFAYILMLYFAARPRFALDRPSTIPANVSWLRVEKTRHSASGVRAAGVLAHAWKGIPQRPSGSPARIAIGNSRRRNPG
jgi:hypothetical protein